MAPRVSKIPHHGERSSLQSIKDRNWVSQIDLHPAGNGTIATMLRKGWIESRLDKKTGSMQYRITESGKAALTTKIPTIR